MEGGDGKHIFYFVLYHNLTVFHATVLGALDSQRPWTVSGRRPEPLGDNDSAVISTDHHILLCPAS